MEQEAGAPQFDHHNFIDISAAFNENAKDLCKAQAERMSFRVLNVETDPIEQGIEAEAYDLIITSIIIHAIKNLDITLTNTKKL